MPASACVTDLVLVSYLWCNWRGFGNTGSPAKKKKEQKKVHEAFIFIFSPEHAPFSVKWDGNKWGQGVGTTWNKVQAL